MKTRYMVLQQVELLQRQLRHNKTYTTLAYKTYYPYQLLACFCHRKQRLRDVRTLAEYP